MCSSVLPVCMDVHFVHAWCPESPEKSKKATLKSVYFSSLFQVTVHYSWEVTAAGSYGSWSHHIHSQEQRAMTA